MAASKNSEKRLRILGEDEIEAFYARPRFTEEERIEYFSLSSTEMAVLEEFHSMKSRVCFILQLGYFKARQLFFSVSLEQVEDDVRFIRARYFPDFVLTDLDITKVTRLKQQRVILELCGYRSCSAKERRQLDAKARQAVRIFAKPVYVFRELMHYLAQQRIVMPGYSSLQDTVSRALSHEQARVIALVQAQLKPFDVEALRQLLEDSEGLYEVTQLKREPKDFSVTEIKREIARGERLGPLYWLAQALLPALKISKKASPTMLRWSATTRSIG